jgi:hypothetical protein
MARYFKIKITGGSSPGPYSVYYNTINPANYATRISTSLPATGITYTDLITGTGVEVEIPDETASVILYNELCFSDITYELINVTITQTEVSCNGGADGSITISNPTGGAGSPYQIKINLSGTYETFTTKTYSSLIGGTYLFYVKDSAGNERKISVTITQPTAQTATTTVISDETNVCNGQVQITSSGGTWPKTYKLYLDSTAPYTTCGGTLITTITGVTEGSPTQTVSNLCSGGYCLEVTDANGCVVNSGIVEILYIAPTVTLNVYGKDFAGTPVTENIYYTINGGSSNTLFTGTLSNTCDYVGSIPNLNYNDTVVFTNSYSYIRGDDSTCLSPNDTSATYTIILSSGDEYFYLGVNSGL